MHEILLRKVEERIKHQREVVKHIRTQAFVIASFTFLVARFCIPQDGNEPWRNLEGFDIAAAGCFIFSLFCSLEAGRMTRTWQFNLSPEQLQTIEDQSRLGLSQADLLSITRSVLSKLCDDNERHINYANSRLSLAMLLGTLQILFWII